MVLARGHSHTAQQVIYPLDRRSSPINPGLPAAVVDLAQDQETGLRIPRPQLYPLWLVARDLRFGLRRVADLRNEFAIAKILLLEQDRLRRIEWRSVFHLPGFDYSKSVGARFDGRASRKPRPRKRFRVLINFDLSELGELAPAIRR